MPSGKFTFDNSCRTIMTSRINIQFKDLSVNIKKFQQSNYEAKIGYTGKLFYKHYCDLVIETLFTVYFVVSKHYNFILIIFVINITYFDCLYSRIYELFDFMNYFSCFHKS